MYNFIKSFFSKSINEKIVSSLNNKLFRDLEKLSHDNSEEKIIILCRILDIKSIVKLGIGLSTPDIVIESFHSTIDEEIKDLTKTIHHLKKKHKLSTILNATSINKVKGYTFFTSHDKRSLDIAEYLGTFSVKCEELARLVLEIKNSDVDIDRANYYTLRNYILNVSINMESIVRLVTKS